MSLTTPSPSDPEPTFTLRGQDKLTLKTMGYYAVQCSLRGLHDQRQEVNAAIREMDAWQKRHPERMKFPDKKHKPSGGHDDG